MVRSHIHSIFKPKAANAIMCSRCDREYARSPCLAKRKQCNKCKQLNHFSAVCKSGCTNISELETTKSKFLVEVVHCDLLSSERSNITIRLPNGKISNLPVKIDTESKSKHHVTEHSQTVSCSCEHRQYKKLRSFGDLKPSHWENLT